MEDRQPSSHETVARLSWGAGIAIGMGAGVALGTALDNMAVGIGLGLAIGVALMALVNLVRSRSARRRSSASGTEGGTVAHPDADDGPDAGRGPSADGGADGGGGADGA